MATTAMHGSASPTVATTTRFSSGERAVHWTNAALFFVLFATGAALYAGPVSTLVGRRDLMRWLHVITGLALPFPLFIGWLRSPGLRADLRRLNRWTPDDWRWLRRRRSETGKFNAGQKLNAAFVVGSIPVMLATGIIMKWFEPFPLTWRTGATFVHDVLAITLVVVTAGHITMALRTRTRVR